MHFPDEDASETIWRVLSFVAAGWYSLQWSIVILGWYTARKRYSMRPRSPLASASPNNVEGVSIIRPLKGLDPNLFENLETSFTQEYPKFEIILSVANEEDQALRVARELMLKYPGVDAKVVIGEKMVGVNPKVNNIIRAYQQAQYDILWVMDSNVNIHPGSLARSVDALIEPSIPNSPNRKRVGIVHHVPFALVSEPGIGSRLDEAFLNTTHAKMYLAINAVAIDSCVIGKSNMYRRSDVDRLTGTLQPYREDISPPPLRGLEAFGRFLAEDNMIGSALWHELGLRHELSCDIAFNEVGNMTFSAYVWRRVRWIRVRKHMSMVATLLEPLTESVVLGLLAGWCFNDLFGFPLWVFFPAHIVAWLAVDLDVYASLAGHPLPALKRWPFLAAWACRELLAFPIWILAIFGNEVEWRNVRYRITRNGEARRADKPGRRTEIARWVVGKWKGTPESKGYQVIGNPQ